MIKHAQIDFTRNHFSIRNEKSFLVFSSLLKQNKENKEAFFHCDLNRAIETIAKTEEDFVSLRFK